MQDACGENKGHGTMNVRTATSVVMGVFLLVAEQSAAGEVLKSNCSIPSLKGEGKRALAFLREVDLSLPECHQQGEVYRVTLYEAHHAERAVAWRIDVNDAGHAQIIWKSTNLVMNVKQTPHLSAQKSVSLSATQLEQFRGTLKTSGFWNIESNWTILGTTKDEDGNTVQQSCMPGGFTSIEAVRDGKYHEVGWLCFEPDGIAPLLDEFSVLTKEFD